MSIRDRYRISKSVSQNIPLSQVDGGFPFAALLPLAAAAGVPLAASLGKWAGKKIFGQGLRPAGASMGMGLMRAGDMLAPQNRPLHMNPLMGPTKSQSAYVSAAPSAVRGGAKKKCRRSTRSKK